MREIRLKSPWEKSSAWARLTPEGALELELYDFSEEAERWLGNDVAWIWRVAPEHVELARRAIAWKAGHPVAGDEDLLAAIATHFASVHAARDWLKKSGVPVEEKFDSRA